MSLAEALDEPFEQLQPGPWCTMGEWLRKLDDEDHNAATKALAGNVSDRTLWRRLVAASQDDGIPTLNVSDQTFARHRNGECRKCRG